jgi:hypothetical protein
MARESDIVGLVWLAMAMVMAMVVQMTPPPCRTRQM